MTARRTQSSSTDNVKSGAVPESPLFPGVLVQAVNRRETGFLSWFCALFSLQKIKKIIMNSQKHSKRKPQVCFYSSHAVRTCLKTKSRTAVSGTSYQLGKALIKTGKRGTVRASLECHFSSNGITLVLMELQGNSCLLCSITSMHSKGGAGWGTQHSIVLSKGRTSPKDSEEPRSYLKTQAAAFNKLSTCTF